ncbi:MAG: CopL family metal-binding regulatory protein [Burkholderiales bacterium]
MTLLRLGWYWLLMFALLFNGASTAVAGAMPARVAQAVAEAVAAAPVKTPCHPADETSTVGAAQPHSAAAASGQAADAQSQSHDCCKSGCNAHCSSGGLAVYAYVRSEAPFARTESQVAFRISGYISPALARLVRPPIA